MSPLFAAITGVAGIAGAVYGIFKWIVWATKKTDDQLRQDIDADVKKQSAKEQQTGRPS